MSQSEETRLALIDERLRGIEKTLTRVQEDLENKYITHEQFTPVRLIAYGFAGAVLGGFALALVALVLRT